MTSLDVSGTDSTKMDHEAEAEINGGARARTCTESGNEFFRTTVLKNRDRQRKKIVQQVEKINKLLTQESLENAKELDDNLTAVHEEFIRSHVRYQELSGDNVDSSAERDIYEKVLLSVTDAHKRLLASVEAHHDKGRKEQRLLLSVEIGSRIREAQSQIDDGKLSEADTMMGDIEILFSEFMECAPECDPTCEGSIGNDEEGKLTDQIDSAVFEIKNQLISAKNVLKSNSRSSTPRNLLYSHKSISVKSLPPLPVTSFEGSFTSRSHQTKFPDYERRSRSKSRPSQRRSSPHASQRSLSRDNSKRSHSNTSRYSNHSNNSGQSAREKNFEEKVRSAALDGSKRSRSNTSRSSNHSNISSQSARERAIEEKVHLAALKIESKYLQQSQESEIEKRRLEMEANKMAVEREIAIAEARVRVYEEHIQDDMVLSLKTADQSKYDKDQSNQKVEHSEHAILNETCKTDKLSKGETLKHKETLKPSEAENKPAGGSSGMKHLADLCRHLKTQSAPDLEMDYFSGDPLQYQYFSALFRELVEKKVDDPLGRLGRLIHYTQGEAKELIQHCIQLPQPDGFNLARELLEKEYGDPHKIDAAYMKELNSWKVIKYNDLQDFKRYYRFLLKCDTNRKGGTSLRLLDNPETLRNLKCKLPFKLQERWSRKAVLYRENNHGELCFSDFLEFVRLECKVLDDPVYAKGIDGADKLRDDKGERERKSYQSSRSNNFNKENVFAAKVEDENKTDISTNLCLYCTEKHDIDECDKFLSLTYREKRSHLFSNKICFYCYGAFSPDAHGFNKCEKKICKICNESHPTALHRNTGEKDEEVSSRATQAEDVDGDSSTVSMPIVPVMVYHSKFPGKYAIVYALLDFCSSGVFISQDCADNLGVDSLPVKYTGRASCIVRTVNGR